MKRLLIPFLALALCPPAIAGLGKATSATAASSYDAWCGEVGNDCTIEFKNQKIIVDGKDSVRWSDITYITEQRDTCSSCWTPQYTFGIEYQEGSDVEFAEVIFRHQATAKKFWRDLRRACRECVDRDAERIQIEVK